MYTRKKKEKSHKQNVFILIENGLRGFPVLDISKSS